MKTYYLVKVSTFSPAQNTEQREYFGKQHRLLGYIVPGREDYDVLRYYPEDLAAHAYVSFGRAKSAARKIAAEAHNPALTRYVTIIAETVQDDLSCPIR